MTWLVTGAHGMLGTDLREVLAAHGVAHTGLDRGDLDLLDEAAVSRVMAGHDVVVNCAAWTDVDGAESREGEAFEINAVAAGVLARAAHTHGARIVHLSTDYVFGGDAGSPYPENAPLTPRSAYGRTKAAGEWAVRAEAPGRHLVVRTGWLYGAHGSSFPRTILRVARDRGGVDVVDDQRGQPTWTRDVAELIVRLVDAEAPSGTWHATSGGETTWYQFAREVVASAGLSADVVRPTDSGAFKRDAVRPTFSVLGHDGLAAHGIEPIGPWEERWAVAASEIVAVDQLQ